MATATSPAYQVNQARPDDAAYRAYVVLGNATKAPSLPILTIMAKHARVALLDADYPRLAFQLGAAIADAEADQEQEQTLDQQQDTRYFLANSLIQVRELLRRLEGHAGRNYRDQD